MQFWFTIYAYADKDYSYQTHEMAIDFKYWMSCYYKLCHEYIHVAQFA